MSTPRKTSRRLPRRHTLGALLTERHGVLSLENTSLRERLEKQGRQVEDLKKKLRDSIVRENDLRRRLATLSEKQALAAGAPRRAKPLTTTLAASSSKSEPAP